MSYKKKILFLEAFKEKLEKAFVYKGLLEALSRDIGEDSKYHKILFPAGIESLLEFFENHENQKMLDYLSNSENPSSITQSISKALICRITQLSRAQTKNLMAIYSMKLFTKIAISNSFNTCDYIWKYAKDSSTDFNYYSKRTILMGVYTSSKLAYISSENDQELENFVNDSLNAVVNFFKYTSKVKEIKNIKFSDIPILRMFL